MTQIINDTFETRKFPDALKLAEVIPVYKKKDVLNQENYRPISLLSYMSKIFEKIIYKQISDHIEPYLSNLLTGFRKNHYTQNSLLKMIEKWKESLDKGYYVDAIILWTCLKHLTLSIIIYLLQS